MTGLFGKLFGKKKGSDGPEGMVDDLLGQIIELARFELSYDIKALEDGTLHVDVFGKDEEMLTYKEGQLLDALQLFVRRAIQHQLPEGGLNVNLDCANFREEADKALIALAEKLKGIVLSKGKSVYFRALPPKCPTRTGPATVERPRMTSEPVLLPPLRVVTARLKDEAASGSRETKPPPFVTLRRT